MNFEIVNPFVTASHSVIEMVLGCRPVKGTLSAQSTFVTSEQCNVLFGVTGQVEGQVIIGMSLQTADKVASTMIGEKIKKFDQLAASAIGELGNMICGNALKHLHGAGHICDITPPTIIRGTDIRVDTISIAVIVIPLILEQGEMTIAVGLQEHK